MSGRGSTPGVARPADPEPGGAGRSGRLAAAARRALEEAEARRHAARAAAEYSESSREVDGRGGADPVRYGDWEVKGRAVDF